MSSWLAGLVYPADAVVVVGVRWVYMYIRLWGEMGRAEHEMGVGVEGAGRVE
jgi:hypothetical protein